MSHKVNNQCIHCSVGSCEYHALDGQCSLSDIQVAPKANNRSGQADESQCSSYKCRG